MGSADLIIRGAQVFDGSGGEPRRADVAVKNGRIATVGALEYCELHTAGEVVDADGMALMPGIVDLHTHYDAQVTWDATCSPSPALGVTTAVIGNCGFGIAPCPPERRDLLLKNLSVVEGMDLAALLQGTRWDFETFPQYMDMLRKRGASVNLAVFAGHSVIRTAVMGAEASTRSEPSDEQLRTMVALADQAMDAGAIGFASSFSPNHSGYGGVPMPSTIATDAELDCFIDVLARKKRGVFMSATGSRASPEYMERLAERSGRPMFITTVLTMYSAGEPERGYQMYQRCLQAQQRGRELYIQTSCQPLSFEFDMLTPYVFFSHSAFEAVKAANGDPRRLRDIYADRAMREQFRVDLTRPAKGILFTGDWRIIEVAEPNDDGKDRSIAALARAAGIDPVDYLFDLALEKDFKVRFIGKFFQNDDAGVARLLKHPVSVVALSDAGAHMSYLCDAGYGVHLLSHWVRETGTLELADAVRRLTSHPADLYRIPERGRLDHGYWADMVLFDPERIELSGMRPVADLPGGASRMMRQARGIHGVWVNGRKTYDGQRYLCDGAAGPGQVIDHFAP